MTIYRFDSWSVIAVLGLLFVSPASGHPESVVDRCGNVDPTVARRCVAAGIAEREKVLADMYPKALATVRTNFARNGDTDDRSNPRFLANSQAAWKTFVESDCTVQAAFGGGSNMSVLDRYDACYEAALAARIEFLGQIADGSFGTG